MIDPSSKVPTHNDYNRHFMIEKLLVISCVAMGLVLMYDFMDAPSGSFQEYIDIIGAVILLFVGSFLLEDNRKL